ATLPSTIETWLLEPIAAPTFALPDLRGKSLALNSFRGTSVLLYFWTSELRDYLVGLQQLNRHQRASEQDGLQLLTVNLDSAGAAERLRAVALQNHLSIPILPGAEDVGAVYNILYRYLFDRHRDLMLPTSFLINPDGEIVKVYQGPLQLDHVDRDFRELPKTTEERIAKALPFSGVNTTIDFPRNYLSYGSVFFQRGYLEQAEASFHRALRDDPTSAEALYGIGSVYLQQQKAADAKQAFERTIKA